MLVKPLRTIIYRLFWLFWSCTIQDWFGWSTKNRKSSRSIGSLTEAQSTNYFHLIMDWCILNICPYLSYKVSEWRQGHFEVHICTYKLYVCSKSQFFVKLDRVWQAIKIKNVQIYFHSLGISRCWKSSKAPMTTQALSNLKCYNFNFRGFCPDNP